MYYVNPIKTFMNYMGLSPKLWRCSAVGRTNVITVSIVRKAEEAF